MSVKGKQIMEIKKANVLCVTLAVLGLPLCAMADGESQEFAGGSLSAALLCREGDRLLHGRGCERDLQGAVECYMEAADMGCLLAKSIVGRDKWYGRLPGGQEEGLELVREAEEQGNVTAYRYLEELDKTGSL